MSKEESNILQELRANGQKTPVEFMIAIYNRKDLSLGVRLEAAKSAAPYIDKKQPLAMEHGGELSVIQPYVPSREALREDYKDELEDDDYDDL